MVCGTFTIRPGPAWELWLKPCRVEKRPVPSSRTYIGQDDDEFTISEKIVGLVKQLGNESKGAVLRR